MKTKSLLRGVIPANLISFDKNLDIDEVDYRRHLKFLKEIDEVSAIATNGHAAEISTLSFKEQQKSLSITLDEVGDKVSVICGVYEDGSNKAAEIAKMAESEGADYLLCFPSQTFSRSMKFNPEMAYNHYLTIAEATNLPMIIFVYPVNTGVNIPTDTLVKICKEIDNVVATKDNTLDLLVYERNYRALKSLEKDISVLTTYSKSLLATLCVGADGILSGHGSLIADLQIKLFNAVQEKDLEKARLISDEIYPLVEVFYANPLDDMHNRMKEASVMLGRMKQNFVRPPLQKLSEKELEDIQKVILEANLS